MRKKLPDDVVSDKIKDNETWNTCPRCNKSWKTIPAIPGMIHLTRYCEKCKEDRTHRIK